MKIAVRYHSRSGNTKKVAEAVAKAAGADAADCGTPLAEAVDLLFVGGAVYGGKVDEALQNFIVNLDPAKVKAAAVFGTSALAKKPGRGIEKLLKERGIPLLGPSFRCRGAFWFMNRGRPNGEDLRGAAEFARAALGGNP
ncbi:MAG: flavodoxin [Treponema sp.]|jgi:flavodoxin|nr:flavodoxin [Treponema sp.]